MSTKEIILDDEYWEDVEEGTEALVEEWLIKEGDQVKSDQVIANLVVVKTSVELVAGFDGTIKNIAVEVDDTFAKGAVLATLENG